MIKQLLKSFNLSTSFESLQIIKCDNNKRGLRTYISFRNFILPLIEILSLCQVSNVKADYIIMQIVSCMSCGTDCYTVLAYWLYDCSWDLRHSLWVGCVTTAFVKLYLSTSANNRYLPGVKYIFIQNISSTSAIKHFQHTFKDHKI